MKKLLYIIITLCLLPMLWCCDDAETQQRLSRAERDRLRREDSAALKVGVLPTVDCLPIVVAKNLRLYDTLGVDVRLRKYGALSECRKALEDSLVEGAVIDTVLMKVIQDKGTALYSAMKTPMQWQFLTSKKARISRIAQMTDKIIGADLHGATHVMAENAIDSMLKKNQHVFIIQVEDVQIRQKMLASGNIDAAFLPEPFATKAKKSGAKQITSIQSKPCGVVAFRTKGMADKTRKQQQELFLKAVSIAKDSIAKYGEKRYLHFLEW